MIELTKCYPDHLRLIDPQTDQIEDGRFIRSGVELDYMCSQKAFTAWDGVRPIGAAGLMEIWSGRYEAWCILSPRAARHMLAITRKMQLALRVAPALRVEMHVVHSFKIGHKWAKMLGFSEENGPGTGLRKNYGRNGEDYIEYVRLRNWPQPQ